MRLRTTLLPGLLAGALPLAGFAQTGAPAAFKPQLFVGLGAAVGSPQSPTAFAENILAPALTAGVQLRPRLAVQASAQYFQRKDSYFQPGLFYFNGGLHEGISSSTDQQRIVAVPVLVRYALTRRPEQRLQVDVLGGFTLARSTYRSKSTTVDSLQNVVYNSDNNYVNNNFYLDLGAGLRYRLGNHLALTGDLVFNFLVNQHPYNSTSSTAALGLRYRFGGS
ncbi:outer membrane beta-barrel protein [Hymenobacter coccineus]|uniref:Outer membrane protein beta-barrel domain-containing protein n=1 Tax=Hymenobacter coccineus TaxID=1908235 RepID=A0A1G1T065_9BACT|nr:outer membrane beta-barrel protein [Hymenobacter coccineus]OGX84273.1 hypothetical protein BEN49_11410 [Hymenobacter coccineus]